MILQTNNIALETVLETATVHVIVLKILGAVAQPVIAITATIALTVAMAYATVVKPLQAALAMDAQ